MAKLGEQAKITGASSLQSKVHGGVESEHQAQRQATRVKSRDSMMSARDE